MAKRGWKLDKKKILVIGSLNMDWVLKVEDIPVIEETVLGGDIQESPGGKGANQAFAAGRLNGDVTMLGAVGCDENGRTLLENLKLAGVHTEFIPCRKKAPRTRCSTGRTWRKTIKWSYRMGVQQYVSIGDKQRLETARKPVKC